MNLLVKPVRSSLGKKYAMAVTGLLLIGFVLGHMAGNLLIYLGPDAINSYAHALKSNPGLLWTARIGLLLVFVIHVLLGVTLALENRAARPQRYEYDATLRASWASRNMMLTGLVILAFVIYHLAHFTLGVVTTTEDNKNYLDLVEVKQGLKTYVPEPSLNLSQLDPNQVDARHDVYRMVVSGFQIWWVSVSYWLAMAFLGLHLWHGGSSFLQTLGLNSFRYASVVRLIGPLLAILVVIGNSSIPLAVMLGLIK